LCASGCYRIAGRWLELDPPEHRVKAFRNVMVPMRDGVRLATDIYEPKDRAGPLPVVLTRLPYDKDNMSAVGKLLAQRGYIYVVQDSRACFKSEGEVFVPMVYGKEDGLDTIEWISEQEWFDGNLGMWGPSYLGITQWAVAADAPQIKALYPQITAANLNQTLFLGGAFSYRLATSWTAGVGKQSDNILPVPIGGKLDMETEGFFNLPLEPELDIEWEELRGLSVEELLVKMSEAMGLTPGDTSPEFVDKMIGLMNYPAFAENTDAFDFHDRYDEVTAPALMVSGWFDIFVDAQIHDFVKMREMAPGDASRYTRIIIGPWGHVSGFHPDAEKGARLGALIRDFMVFDWYDRWLKGEMNGIENAAPMTIYVMGRNEWRDEQEWPLKRTEYTKYFLHSGGNANSKSGDGVLSTEEPGDEPADEFTYDPKDPVPTAGGHNLLENVGPKEQKDVEVRDDVLIFSTPPLEKDIEVTGPITAVIYAASSAVDTDFTVKLCDVYPNGASIFITEGIVRARYRESYTEPSLIEPGEVYKYQIKLWPTSNCFLKGHKIRIQVSSSSFPRFDRNTNAGGAGGPMNIVVANQTIYHDEKRPSYVTLPLIP
jgi:predicted acyl esterase